MSKTKQGSKVRVHIEILNTDGEIVEESDPDEPFEMDLGSGELPPSVEHEMLDKAAGDVIEVLCPEGEAFGDASPEAIVSVPREEFPDDVVLEKGGLITVNVENEAGEESEMPAMIVEVSPEGVILDANHPLAGQAAMFKVTIVEVRG